MAGQDREFVVGLDKGGTAINATVLDSAGRFLVDRMVETPSRVGEGPAVAIEALSDAFTGVLRLTGVSRQAVRAVGLDTPGPASADGVISTRGAVNFAHAAWRGFDVRGTPVRLSTPVNAWPSASIATSGPSPTRLGVSTSRSTRNRPAESSTVALIAVPPLSRPTTYSRS